MRVEKVRNEEGRITEYILVGEDFVEVDVVTDFISYLRVKNYSPNTLKNYVYDLRYYFDYLDRIERNYKEIRPKDMVGFVEYLKQQPSKRKPSNMITLRDIAEGQRSTGKISASTVKRIIACVSSFYDWVKLDDDGYEGNPLPEVVDYKNVPITDSFKGFLSYTKKNNATKSKFLKVKVPKTLPRPVAADITKLILESFKTKRDKAILFLSLQGGLRIGEILGLTFEDINFRKREVNIVYREDNPNSVRVKGSKERVVQLYEPEALNCLNDYILYERPDNDCDYIFLSGKGKTKGQPLSYQGINTVFNYHCKKLGLKTEGKGMDLTLHAFRHTHATKMYEGGMSLLSLQKRLGHESPTSTQVYTKVSDKYVKEEYKRVIDDSKE